MDSGITENALRSSLNIPIDVNAIGAVSFPPCKLVNDQNAIVVTRRGVYKRLLIRWYIGYIYIYI